MSITGEWAYKKSLPYIGSNNNLNMEVRLLLGLHEQEATKHNVPGDVIFSCGGIGQFSCDNRSKQHAEAMYGSFDYIGPTRTS